jgi:integrase
MPREDSPYIIGDYWLDKRRAGRSPDFWQIAWYDHEARSIVYRSTKCRTVDLERAKEVLRSFEAQQRSKSRAQDIEHSPLLPHLFNYIRERSPEIGRVDTIKTSFRAWIGFLQQDELTTGAVVADVTKTMIARFRRWRMGPHSWVVEWGGKTFRHTSDKVTGETVQRNIEDLRAALHHAQSEGRIKSPRIPSVERKFRSEARDTVLTTQQLGAILGYASQTDNGAYRWLCLMIATSSRPGPALAFNPRKQWHGDVIDLHPGGGRTAKRNAVVPVIAPMVPILEAWKAEPHEPVKSRKKWWATMARALNLPSEVIAYTIRRTVATWLDKHGVPGADISGITGHLPSSRGVARITSRHYLAYDPRNCPEAVDALTALFQAVQRQADDWNAVHLLCIPKRGRPLEVVKRAEQC